MYIMVYQYVVQFVFMSVKSVKLFWKIYKLQNINPKHFNKKFTFDFAKLIEVSKMNKIKGVAASISNTH